MGLWSTNDFLFLIHTAAFSIIIQWKFHLTVIPFLNKVSLQSSEYA